MKIRTGFVSNSSSSSFVAVGVSGYSGYDQPKPSKFLEILNAVGCPDYEGYDEDLESKFEQIDYGVWRTKEGINIYGGYEPFFVGIDAEPGIRADKNLSTIKKEFQNILSGIGVKVSLNDLNLEISEVSSE